MAFYQQQQQQPGASQVPPTSRPGFGAGVPPPDYMRFQNVSPEMINFGLHAGQDILSRQREKWMPGVFGFWLTLKSYFSVSNNYVLKKLGLILYPLNNKAWTRLPADEFERGEGDQVTHKWALPKQDYNAPDLYIPLMAFITYILLCGFYEGMRVATSSTFSPEIIIQATWRCIALHFVESSIAKFSLNMLSVPVPFLDVFSYAGYKYVPLCLNILGRMTFAAVVPPAAVTQPTQRHAVLFGFALAQLLLVFIMSVL
eukprot:scaffold289_cov169-Ochromonas_danica.AAC.16